MPPRWNQQKSRRLPSSIYSMLRTVSRPVMFCQRSSWKARDGNANLVSCLVHSCTIHYNWQQKKEYFRSPQEVSPSTLNGTIDCFEHPTWSSVERLWLCKIKSEIPVDYCVTKSPQDLRLQCLHICCSPARSFHNFGVSTSSGLTIKSALPHNHLLKSA